nr:radical SAM protein [Candidatus Njordarchaeota archaeon]
MKSNLLLLPKVVGFVLQKHIGHPKMFPSNITFSVTNRCNSRCKTCFIWDSKDRQEWKEKEFELIEFTKVFESLGKNVVWMTLSGGEPFLRRDLPQVCEVVETYCDPRVVNIPTNCLLPNMIRDGTKRIMEQCEDMNLVVNLSLDGVNEAHDTIRGVPGNFKKFLETYSYLSELKKEFPKLNVGVHSVVSRFNVKQLMNVYDFVKTLDPDSYITEVAERRTELYNVDKDITPSPEDYARFIHSLSKKVRVDYLSKAQLLSKVIQAFRLTYYQIAAQNLKYKRQIIPCYAGIASCQITPYGYVWPCCILGYKMVMGNLREANYDFRKVWYSPEAERIRRFISGKNCSCPLANAHYTNILCNPAAIMRVAFNLIIS